MANYDERPVPRGTSRRWEVLMSDDEGLPRRAPGRLRTAGDVRAEHRVLAGLPAGDLEAIPLLAEGQRLVRLREYLDLHDPGRAAFVAEGEEIVEPGQHVVARAQVAEDVWDELVRACDSVLGRESWHRLRPAV